MKRLLIKTACLAVAAAAAGSVLTAAAGALAAEQESFISGEDTVHAIASISKVYVSAAAMQLADKGLLDIDEPIVTYIPEFEMADPRYKDITARMLMEHTSGLMGTTNNKSFLLEDNDDSFNEEFLSNLKLQRLKADPGEFAVYCNDGFDLLMVLVERISGMDFTDYLTQNIAGAFGGVQTGTAQNMLGNEHLTDIFVNRLPFAHEFHVSAGAGGILSTAPELCRFGSTFFKGDNTLLSDESKAEMSRTDCADVYEGRYGLGWDDVDYLEGSGVTVLMKNGGLINQYSSLMVAPDEEVSVAVLQSGGDGAAVDMLAKSLLETALVKKGADFAYTTERSPELLNEIPEKYSDYEGVYSTDCTFFIVTFPDMKYMSMEILSAEGSELLYFKYSADDNFVLMAGEPGQGFELPDSDCRKISFITRGHGRKYLAEDNVQDLPCLNSYEYKMYAAEKLEPAASDPSAAEAWKKRCGKYYLANDKYSSMMYPMNYCIELFTNDMFEGYVFSDVPHKIKDDTHAEAFLNIPNNNGRDQFDISFEEIDGKGYIVKNSLERYISEDSMAQLTTELEEVTFTEQGAQWFRTDRDMGKTVLRFERSEHTAVYIYDDYDNMIYNTYMAGYDNGVTLPTEGKIAFIGEPGEKITIIK